MFYKALKVAYNSFYFYFFPFVVIFLNIISKSCEQIYDPEIVQGGYNKNGTIKDDFLCKRIDVFYLK